MKEAIIYLLFDNWCNSEHEPEVKEAMDKAIQNPTEDTIFQLSSITEANAFKAGVRECLKMFRNYFVRVTSYIVVKLTYIRRVVKLHMNVYFCHR